LKKRILILTVVVTLMSIVLFTQSVLGASYYYVKGQLITYNKNTDTYKEYNSANVAKEYTRTGTQKITYVYPYASQGANYIQVFPSRGTGNRPPSNEEPQQPPVEPEPQPPVEPEPQPPVEPEPQPPVEPEPQPPVEQDPPKNPGTRQLTADEQKLINLINSERTNAGLKPLAIDYELSRVARIKSEDMRTNSYFSHTSPTYGSPFKMMKDFGITYRGAAENIARTSSVDRAHTGFMNSEGHRKNILTPSFTHIGVGISGNYYTEMFISK
jgi:uncharacterized YkwD family protein